jgi:hypothetical protein
VEPVEIQYIMLAKTTRQTAKNTMMTINA